MIEGVHPLLQALMGTLFTWGLTAAGSALVFVFSGTQRKVLDGSLGFAAGVMTAASYWSLLAPAIELAERSGYYGDDGQLAFVPATLGFILGAVFVYGADIILPMLNISDPTLLLAREVGAKVDKREDLEDLPQTTVTLLPPTNINSTFNAATYDTSTMQRRRTGSDTNMHNTLYSSANSDGMDYARDPTVENKKSISWKRILLLVIAITIHNIPEGMAVGVGFGAIGKTPSATFENARNLAIGIGIQNFPEGLAVSLPLKASGISTWTSFWYGQLSGMVEPLAGLVGAIAVVLAEPLLPYALAFAAGAMIYVVFDDIIPEAHTSGNGRLATWGGMLGFCVMMALDVGLG